MRILVSTLTPYPSGTAHVVHITATAQGFVDAGHDVTLVAAQPGPGWPADVAPHGADELPVRHLAERDHRGQSFVNGWRLYRLANRVRPDAAFADNARSALALAFAGIPVILELHSMQFSRSALDRLAFRRLLRRPELRSLVTISAALRDDVAPLMTVAPQNIVVLPEAARARTDHELQELAPEWLTAASRPDAFQVGYTGSLYGGRGVDLLISIAHRLPEIDVHVLGGPQEDAEALALRTDLPANLLVHGLRPVSDAERFQSAMDVLLAPYARSVQTPGGVDTSRWMSPMKLFEYLAAGRAIVCSDLPVLHEAVEHEVTALLVEPEDPEAWTRAIRRLRDDPSLRESLGLLARETHATRFTWEERTRGLLNAWRMTGPTEQAS